MIPKKFQAVNIAELMFDQSSEVEFQNIMDSYSCPLNPDVEYFLKHTAAHNQKMNISRTSLVYEISTSEPVLVGYYSLALQVLDLSCITSKSLRRKITGFKRESKTGAAVYLLGQLGKNFHAGIKDKHH